MQDQQTAPPPEEERTHPEFDRRRGPRRAAANGDVQVGNERRGPDRRKKKPGLAGLWGAIFSRPGGEQKTEK